MNVCLCVSRQLCLPVATPWCARRWKTLAELPSEEGSGGRYGLVGVAHKGGVA